MIPSWTEQYVGLPYEQANCWSLTRKVLLEQFGVALPSYDAEPIDKAIADALQNYVTQVTDPQLGDVVLMERLGRPHIGVMLDGERMLHTTSGKNAVVERLSRFRFRVTGFYRVSR